MAVAVRVGSRVPVAVGDAVGVAVRVGWRVTVGVKIGPFVMGVSLGGFVLEIGSVEVSAGVTARDTAGEGSVPVEITLLVKVSVPLRIGFAVWVEDPLAPAGRLASGPEVGGWMAF